MTRAENVAAFRKDMADLLKREEGCLHCQKARRINDEGKVNHPRQCWVHMDQRQTLALRTSPC